MFIRPIILCLVISVICLTAQSQTKVLPLPGESFEFEGRQAFIIRPENSAAKNLPWVWYAPTLPNLPGGNEKWMFERFLQQGIAIAGVDVGESFGSPQGRQTFSKFYDYVLKEKGLKPKPCLLARSRGGLMLYNWAIENPTKVSGIAGIYPVCSIASYPSIKNAAPAYGMSADQLQANLNQHNPVTRLAPLAAAKVPLHHIHGDKDQLVPLEANSGALAEHYRKLGGSIELDVIKDGKHDGWAGWFQSSALTNFVIERAIDLVPDTDDEGFKPIFNGKDLTLWDGNPDLWSVNDGIITGRSTNENKLKRNEFLIWRGGYLKDFELRVVAKMTGNNSGIQYRSKENANAPWSVKGYQCDVIPNQALSAMLYEEGGRGIIAQNGQTVVADPSGKRHITKQNPASTGDVADWREYTIIAKGNHLIHKLDGKVTMEFTDHDAAKRSLAGVLAFQLHAGPAMTMQIKSIRLKQLPSAELIAFNQASIATAKQAGAKKPAQPAPAAAAAPAKSTGSGEMHNGQWIWHTTPTTGPGSRLRKDILIANPELIESATLLATCDNGAKVYLNGKHIGTNSDWQHPVRLNLLKDLKVGQNQITVDAGNTGGIGGFAGSITLKNKQGKVFHYPTNATWLAAAPKTENWAPAVAVAKYGNPPWGDIFKTTAAQPASKPGEAIDADEIGVPEGFKVEKLYDVPKKQQGSWVALATDEKGRLLACDQYGSIYRMDIPAIGSGGRLKPEKVNIELGKAHGLLVAFDSLYVMVNEAGAGNGLYRVTDSNGDDQYDKVEMLHRIPGGGEHGIHSIVTSPDGKQLYFNCGNSAHLPVKFDKSRAPKHWDEDHILPRLWDGNGFMRGKMKSAAGYVFSIDPDGSKLEMLCHGFRNQFDIAFDHYGELFTYDADMEWDIGAPWYRQTRVNHCVSGADYGWHAGTGKWPDYYPDNLPTTIDIGPGSPTGVVSGKGAKFPEKYQRAIYVADWTYGTMWAIHLTPDGSTYRAEKEDFLHGKPLPLTDVIINPHDGSMIVAVGGRRTQSGVYRVTYTGSESTAPIADMPKPEAFIQRNQLEAFHVENSDFDPNVVIAKAWPFLDHSDRYLRHAARIAIEHLPVETWQEKALSESRSVALIESIIALARSTGSVSMQSDWPHSKTSSGPITAIDPKNVALQNRMWDRLNTLDFASLSNDQKLAALRAYQLVYTRLGKPGEDRCSQLASRLQPLYPSTDQSMNRELIQLLVAVDCPQVVPQTLTLLTTETDSYKEVAEDSVISRNDQYARALRTTSGSRPNPQQLFYLIALRNVKAGWTPEHRRTYFSWFSTAKAWKGGNSFSKYVENARLEAIALVAPETEKADLNALSSKTITRQVKLVPPKGPGKNYSLDETVTLINKGLNNRDYTNGKNMYHSVMCATCHRFDGSGGSIGPDLTGSANRYTVRDLMSSIIHPNEVISDQYESHTITKTDGSKVIGRIVVEENGKVFVITNPFAPNDQIAIDEKEIAKKEPSGISMMPPSLINALNEQELLDLVAYMMSGGDENHKMFKR